MKLRYTQDSNISIDPLYHGTNYTSPQSQTDNARHKQFVILHCTVACRKKLSEMTRSLKDKTIYENRRE